VKERVKISVGALGDFELPAGLYVYTGSAKRNILARVSRHLSGRKKIRWHIDYLLSHPLARIIDVKLLEKDECEANQELEGQILIPRFGLQASLREPSEVSWGMAGGCRRER
jgi:Uri superfamily endonuclease